MYQTLRFDRKLALYDDVRASVPIYPVSSPSLKVHDGGFLHMRHRLGLVLLLATCMIRGWDDIHQVSTSDAAKNMLTGVERIPEGSEYKSSQPQPCPSFCFACFERVFLHIMVVFLLYILVSITCTPQRFLYRH